MTPKPEGYAQSEPGETNLGEDVVISGMAGLYPNSRDVKELSDILYNKINPIKKTDRWTSTNYSEASQHIGTIPDPEYFDAQFFKVHYRLSDVMDPMSRKLLEQTYQAIFDAGYNPEQLSGRKIGVFVGTCFSETEKTHLYVLSAKSGLGIAGCNRSMFSNRISYYLNIKGPSMTIDMSCCSSAGSLEMAYDAICRGECEGAIVGGCTLCLHPQTTIHYGRAIDVCRDGKTKSFDAKADGCCKSEAVNIIFLQKAKYALRIYARVVHAKTEFLSLPESSIGAVGGFSRNPADVTRFLKTFYKDANVSPNEVQFVEAFGAGSAESDKAELDAVDEFFCKSRSKPLMVGSVMSNIGYVEAASGISSVTKVLLGYHHGKLAGNLHYKTPRNDITAIREGRIEILNDHKEFTPTYTAINNISLSGIFSHILLHGFNKKKDIDRYKATFPRLMLSSGRHENSIKKIFDYLKSKPIDPEELALLHHFFQKRIGGHLGRGFIILDTKENNETVCLREECYYFDQGKRPLWFVYSGMGSQWVGMGKHLMRIPAFAAAIERCHRVLAPRGIDIVDIITSDDKKTFDNILHSFVGINAIQIGLTDVLRAIDIVPDMIIGHSMGEYCCAYADGCFSVEETILCAYSRGLYSLQTPLIRGSMAAVGIGFKEMSKICPPEIVIACHNSAESCTISGPAEIMSEFVFRLTSQGIFAKEVACSNIAYHSRYVADAAPALLKYMQDLIPTPRPRSSRWVSTSVPQDRWHEPLAKYSSAEYHLNNFLSPVLFEETSQLIPPDAVLIEIAPHGLLQAILKRSLPSTCKQISLTRRGHPDNSQHILEAIGRLYVEGYNPKIEALYPKVEFPVSTSTPMLSHLVDWVYQEEWSLHKPIAANKRTAATSQDVISTYDVEHNYLKGHIIKGRNLYPFSAALVAVWDTLAASLNLKKRELSVQFENVYFHSQPILNEKHQLRPYVAIQKGTGRFEVLNENSVMITGTIIPEITSDRQLQDTTTPSDTNVSADDIYDNILYNREYQYLNDFRSIHSTNESLTEAQIEWKGNWVTFLDGIIQFNILRRKHGTISKLNLIRRIIIDVDKQCNITVVNKDKVFVKAKVLELHDATICGGVVMESLKFIDLPLVKKDNVEFKMCEILPLFSARKINETKTLFMFLQIVADNVTIKERLNVVEIIDPATSKHCDIEKIIDKIPGVKASYSRLDLDEKDENKFKSVDLLITTDLLNDAKIYQKLQSVLRQDTFIIHKHNLEQKGNPLYTVVSAHNIEGGRMELAIWRSTKPDPSNTLIVRTPKNFASKDKQGGEYFVPLEDDSDPEKGVALKAKRIGDFDSIYWDNYDLQNNTVDVQVKVNYVGVNIVYVNKLLGTQFHEDNGVTKSVIDFSGLAKSGSRVMGLLHSDVLSSRVNANPALLLPVPKHWTLEDAATVPLAYAMAFYILAIKVRINSKHVICVQGAAGALGQAVISVALAHGCQVFATVSSTSKKHFLKRLFPQLNDDQIIDHSRDFNFVYNIHRATNGKGCNVLISCATDELKNFSFRCLGAGGAMVDTVVVPHRENYNFGMNNLMCEKMYYPVDFSTIFQPKFAEDIKTIRLLMIDGIRHGYVRPLTRVTYEAQDAPRAFRLQAAGNNRGRVLLDLQHIKHHNIVPSISCTSSSWQLIASDNEKLALKLAERLVARGAKNLVVLLDEISNAANIRKRQWKDNDINVKLVKAIWDTNGGSDLSDSIKDAALESILVITSNEKATKVNTVNVFEEVVSKSHLSLKYFALITIGQANIKPNAWNGTSGHSGITKIVLPDIDVMYDDNCKPRNIDVISINDAMDALERALSSQKEFILVHTSNAPKKTLLEEVMALAEVDPERLKQTSAVDLTLKELNLDNSKLLTIQGFLRDVYELSLNIEDVLKLSARSITELENRCIDSDFEEDHGIASYFPALYDDELLYTTNMLCLPTLATSATSNTDKDLNNSYLCIVPGVEGYYERFTELCERLKLPALVLQPGLDHPNETFTELAHRYINILKKKATLHNNFYLLGYESGVLVALEMAAVLEGQGLTGSVFCIGGTPAEIIKDFSNNLKRYKTQEQLQMGVLKHAYSLITKADSGELDVLNENLEWSRKVDECISLMRGKLPYTIQYTKKWIDNVYRKLSSLLDNTYEIKKLKSQIIHLRPQYSTSIDVKENSSDTNIITYQLESSLSFAHRNMKCARIINSHLDWKTLEIFSKRNICHTYALETENVTSFK